MAMVVQRHVKALQGTSKWVDIYGSDLVYLSESQDILVYMVRSGLQINKWKVLNVTAHKTSGTAGAGLPTHAFEAILACVRLSRAKAREAVVIGVVTQAQSCFPELGQAD